MTLEPSVSIQSVYETITGKISGYFRSAGKTRAVLGLSGGVDSAIVAALAADALGAENVHGILMPSGFSTGHSVTDSLDLAERLGISCETIPISNLYDTAMATMSAFFADGKWSVAQENIQARLRGLILMAYSNKFDALVLNTSNKSELSTGYGTLYGDLAGAMMVIADLYKTQVYELCDFINRDKERIPTHILTKAPSAELREGQKDSDSLPDYPTLDAVLHAMNEEGLSADEVVARFEAEGGEEGAAKARRAVSLRRGSSFKIMQVPPIITVCGKPLAPAFKCI